MTKEPDLFTMWSGKFFRKYKYFVYQLPCSFGPEQFGNYIFAKVVNNQWKAVCIGEGDLHVASNLSSESTCAREKGATHFMAHTNLNEEKRLFEMNDLLSNYTDCYKPIGCNEPPEGYDPSKPNSKFFFWR